MSANGNIKHQAITVNALVEEHFNANSSLLGRSGEWRKRMPNEVARGNSLPMI